MKQGCCQADVFAETAMYCGVQGNIYQILRSAQVTPTPDIPIFNVRLKQEKALQPCSVLSEN